MAKPGNHGIIIPRDRGLLRSLYWDQEKTAAQIGRMFGVGHKSVFRVLRQVGILTRPRGSSPHTKCVECGEPIKKIRHAKNGSLYGKRCAKHQRAHFARLAREEGQRKEVKERIKCYNRRNYYVGPVNIKGEKQWLAISKVRLRNVKRLVTTGKLPKV